jgi:dCMP deaminase
VSIPTWDEYFLNLCEAVAARSKDPNTHVGCVIAGPSREIRSTGYNSFPRGIDDDVPARYERPEKYFWIAHAEENAITAAARSGAHLEHCTAYCSLMPCGNCARMLIQAGIREIVVSGRRMAEWPAERFAADWKRTEQMLDEAGVLLRIYVYSTDGN